MELFDEDARKGEGVNATEAAAATGDPDDAN